MTAPAITAPSGLSFDPEAHRYTRDGVAIPSVTQVLQATGFVDFSYVDAVRLERAAELGRAVHRAIELHVLGDLAVDRLHPLVAARFNAYLQFERETGFVCTAIEQPLAHPLYGYAGTPDQRGHLLQGRAIVDTKISVQLGRWVGLQLAGYEELTRAHEPGDRSPIYRFGLRLCEDGHPLITPFTDRGDRSTFLAALTCATSPAHPKRI